MNSNDLMPISVELATSDDIPHEAKLLQVSNAENSDAGIGLAARVDSVLSLADDVLSLVESSQLYKVEVPDGYSLKDLVTSKKDSKAVRAIVKDPKGKLNGDVSLKQAGINPTQIATMGLAAAAVVVGQAYMTEINESLHRIDSKLSTIISLITGEQKAKVKNAISIANAYANLYNDYLERPPEALQAARTEIEARYNDVGEVIDWMTEQLGDIENRTNEAKASEKEVAPLLDELHSYEEQFELCLQALTALGMTRMYYDGCIDERSALIERQRIEAKTRTFLEKRQRVSGALEIKIGALKGAPIAIPQKKDDQSVFQRLTSQTPRKAAKDQLLETKQRMQFDLRTKTADMKQRSADYTTGIDRIASTSQSAHTLLTDGTNCWVISEED